MTNKSLLLRTKIQNGILNKDGNYMYVCIKEDLENNGTYVRVYNDLFRYYDYFVSDKKMEKDIKSLVSHYIERTCSIN